MKCGKKDCGAEATQGLVINVPAVGCPIPEHDPIRLVVGIPHCATCLAQENAADWFAVDRRWKDIVRMQARGKAEPDFARAFITGISFDSQEWKVLTGRKD